MLISIPCHIFCSGKRLPIPAARPYLSVYSKWPLRGYVNRTVETPVGGGGGTSYIPIDRDVPLE